MQAEPLASTLDVTITSAATDADRDTVRRVLAGYQTGEPIHVVFIGTKPDIIKQAPVIRELTHRGLQVLVCHSGQHTDYAYSGGMLDEFGITVGLHIDMSDQPDLGAKAAALIACANVLFAEGVAAGHTLLPYTHGDTMTAMAGSVAAYLNRIACVHVEAGIRTLSLSREFLMAQFEAVSAGEFDWESYRSAHREIETFRLGSREPFPEQFNTRVADAGTGLHMAPVALDRRFLLNEGFPGDSIVVVGNTVVDEMTRAKDRAGESTIFERFPQLRSGEFIRVCLHRRENTSDERRFLVYFDAVEQLVRSGHSVLWVSLFGTLGAIERFGLQGRLDALVEEFPDTFISTEVWALYGDVIAAMMNCAAIATDSGSMQEEANALGVPCITLRFGSDRGESFLAGGNVLAPPVSADFVATVISCAVANRGDLVPEPIYGTDCAPQLVDAVLARVTLGDGLFRTEEDLLGWDCEHWPDITVQDLPQSSVTSLGG